MSNHYNAWNVCNLTSIFCIYVSLRLCTHSVCVLSYNFKQQWKVWHDVMENISIKIYNYNLFF